jgi:hypothetical protein
MIIRSSSEDISSQLGLNYTSFMDKVDSTRIIYDICSIELDKYRDAIKKEIKEKVKKLTGKDKEEYEYYALNSLGLGHPDLGYDRIVIRRPKVVKLINEETMMYNYREKIQRSFGDMVLIHLVTIFEDFLGKILKASIISRPEILKRKEKTLTYEEILDFDDVKKLIVSMAEKEVRSILNLNIDEIGAHLKKIYKLDLTMKADWTQFKEVFYRRNILVHNDGYPDKKYILKTNYKGNNERLDIEKKYLMNVTPIFKDYADVIFQFFNRKFVYERPPKKPSAKSDSD